MRRREGLQVPRYFVTGTDTGVGKTEVSVALLRLLTARGFRVRALKPLESGSGSDSKRLWSAAGSWQPLASVAMYRFAAPLAPAIAAQKEGRRISWRRLVAAVANPSEPMVVEGAGGVLVPIDARHDVIDLMATARIPVILVARAGLGTINHTALTVRAILQRRLSIEAVILVCSAPRDPSVESNRQELERRFPRLSFVGPVPFERRAARREDAIAKAVEGGVKLSNAPRL